MAAGDSFLDRMRRRGEEVEQGATEQVKAIAREVANTLVLTTPVATGQARSGYVAGKAPTARIPSIDSASGVLARLETEINRHDGSGDLVISNAVPYILALDNGSSEKAPSGMSAKAVQAGTTTPRVKVFKT